MAVVLAYVDAVPGRLYPLVATLLSWRGAAIASQFAAVSTTSSACARSGSTRNP